MTVFQSVKENVTTLQAAERYGLQVNKQGMCKCPFHEDKNPSMKVDKRFHCFGCQADGDVITFASRLFNLTATQAAVKLANDFGVTYDLQKDQNTEAPRPKRISTDEKAVFQRQVDYCFQELSGLRHELAKWRDENAPTSISEEPTPQFWDVIQRIEKIEQQLDVLQSDDLMDKEEVVKECLAEIQKRREGYEMEPIVNKPVYHQSAAYAREHDELDQFRESHWTNVECKKDIEAAIAENFDGFRLNRQAVTTVMEKYGPDRVGTVLAATLQVKAYDGRFSAANKNWAFTYAFPDAQTERGFDRRDSYAVNSHPAVLDGFIGIARQQIQEAERAVDKVPVTAGKESVKEPVKESVKTDVKQAPKKSHDMER